MIGIGEELWKVEEFGDELPDITHIVPWCWFPRALDTMKHPVCNIKTPTLLNGQKDCIVNILLNKKQMQNLSQFCNNHDTSDSLISQNLSQLYLLSQSWTLDM